MESRRTGIQLKKVNLSRSELSSIPEDERHLLVQLGNLGNELNTLYKYLIPLTRQTSASGVEQSAALVRVAFLLRLIAGTVNEAHVVLRRDYFGSVSRAWKDEIPGELVELQRKINDYFSKDNVVRDIRNKFAYHADRVDVDRALAAATDPFVVYFAEVTSNNLFVGPHVVLLVAMLQGVDPDDPQAALSRVLDEVLEVTGWFVSITGLIVHEVFRRSGFFDRGFDLEEITIPDAPLLSEQGTFYFVVNDPRTEAT